MGYNTKYFAKAYLWGVIIWIFACKPKNTSVNIPILDEVKIEKIKDTTFICISMDTFYMIEGENIIPKNKIRWSEQGVCAKILFEPIPDKIDNYDSFYKIIKIDCKDFDCSFLKGKLIFSNLGGHFSSPKIFFGLLKYDSIPAKWRAKNYDFDYIFQYVGAPVSCWEDSWK
jgi:hypothetical protein